MQISSQDLSEAEIEIIKSVQIEVFEDEIIFFTSVQRDSDKVYEFEEV